MKSQQVKEQQMKEKTDCLTFTEVNFQEEVINSKQPVLAVFEAEWSGACDIMTPILEDLCIEFKGRAKIGIIDIDINEKLVEKHRIINIPALVFYNKGEVVDHIIGSVPRHIIEEKLCQIVLPDNK
ncbi:MAG: thiol reductase thioredoxin [Candidatus Zixiibacteriota bacterium]|nr:MAG: thiol reductase thioredoxin [candidate division Zixibacteria bacterium]